MALPPAALARAERRRPLARATQALDGTRTAVVVYVATRVLLVGVGAAVAALEHHSLHSAIGHWDGVWYARLALHGYPTHPVHGPSTLGFLPLFPALIWILMQLGIQSPVLAGALISGVGGLVATILVQRLATGWWGEAAGRRAAVLFCLFPGSVVFSMAYSEGLLIPLAAGCILALERRRWLLAGALAGLATATGADALALTVVCAISAAVMVHRHGPLDRETLRSVLAPLLSLIGIAAFAIFLWQWTGTPLASLRAQRTGWHERLDPLALLHQGQLFASQVAHLQSSHLTVDLSPLAALVGAVVLIWGLVLLLRRPRLVSFQAVTWAALVGALAVFSEHVGPNARVLITAFPVVVVFAYRLRGSAYGWLLGANATLLVIMSALTFTGHSLTP
ncbi:MAG TPA: mannosyltransferase family protein [Solirubrobacteraceae bacterium]|nr:mannosyltransferase family protein [Solirubrobacteraceae bacterium]